MMSKFKIVGTAKVDDVEFAARKKRSSQYDELTAQVKALKIGECAILAIPKGEKPNAYRANVGGAMRRFAQPEMKGTVITRLDKQGRLVISHFPKAADRVKHSPKAKAASGAKGKRKPSKKGKAATAPAADAPAVVTPAPFPTA